MEKVDKFLYTILQNRKSLDANGPATAAAEFLQKSEETIISFIQSDDRSELEFPPLNSFYRRVIHCLGRRYNLVHRVEPTNIFNSNSTLRKIYLTKTVGDHKFQGPILKSSDWLAGIERETGIIETNLKKKIRKTKKTTEEKFTTVAIPKIKILKRETTATASPVELTSPIISTATSPLLTLDSLTLEEKEAKYQAARDRIFEGFTAKEDENVTSKSFTGDDSVAKDSSVTEDTTFVTDVATGETVRNSDNINTTTAATSSIEDLNSTSTCIDNEKQSKTTLNPDAVPFSFTPAVEEAAPEPVIEINHIYTITATSGQLTRDHLKEISAAHPTAAIKTNSSSVNLAFLIFKDDSHDASSSNQKWIISKWIPEFYLD